jgi:hypothetical protein
LFRAAGAGLIELVLTISLLMFLMGGTRGTPSDRPMPLKTLTACAAVTKADVEEALGQAVGRGREETAGRESSCDYAAGNGQVTVTLQRLAAKLDLPFEMRALKAAVPEGRVREVHGIGAVAFFLDIPAAGTQLHVLRGERDYLMVSVLGFGADHEVAAAAEAMARKALGRM